MSDNTFQIQAGALRHAIALAGGAAQSRVNIPVLAHLHIRAEAGRLTLHSTNMETWLSASARGEGTLQPLTASARQLTALLRHVADEEMVALHHPASERPLEITAGALRACIHTLPAEDFPSWPEHAPRVTWRIPAGTLRKLIAQCLHAVSTEETRYYLNGVYLHPHGQGEAAQLHAAATDGHRLMIAHAPMPESETPIPAIWPHDTLRRLQPLLGRIPPDEAIEVAQTDLRLEITTTSWQLHARVIDGTFPDYQRVTPKEGTVVPIQVNDPRSLAKAISTITALSTDRSRPVKLSNGSGNTLRLSHASAEGGEAEMTMPEATAAWASNEAHPETRFQSRYLLDICRVFPAGFTMRVGTLGAPCRVEAAEGLGVLMPMRV